jgi:hypothetical protein
MVIKGGPAQSNAVGTTRELPPSLDEVYNSTDVPQNIPDGHGGVVTSDLIVGDDLTISDINVFVTLTHTWVSDLQVFIRGQQPEVLLLIAEATMVTTLRAHFDDEASTPIVRGRRHFPATSPEQLLPPLMASGHGDVAASHRRQRRPKMSEL